MRWNGLREAHSRSISSAWTCSVFAISGLFEFYMLYYSTIRNNCLLGQLVVASRGGIIYMCRWEIIGYTTYGGHGCEYKTYALPATHIKWIYIVPPISIA